MGSVCEPRKRFRRLCPDELRSGKYAPDNWQHDLLATIDVAAIDYAPDELVCGTKRMRFPYAFRQSDIRARFLFANVRAKFRLRRARMLWTASMTRGGRRFANVIGRTQIGA